MAVARNVTPPKFNDVTGAIRALAMDAVQKANSGHPGAPMGMAEIAEVLGHKTLAMVKRYAHLSEAHTAGVVTRMNQNIFG